MRIPSKLVNFSIKYEYIYKIWIKIIENSFKHISFAKSFQGTFETNNNENRKKKNQPDIDILKLQKDFAYKSTKIHLELFISLYVRDF